MDGALAFISTTPHADRKEDERRKPKTQLDLVLFLI
jgi:hypothetical protein